MLHQYLCDNKMHQALSLVVNSICPGLFSKVKVACENLRCSGDWQKRTRTENNFASPSQAGKKYVQTQKDMQILCHHPPQLSGLHVSLQVKAFGQFMDMDAQEASPKYDSLAIELMMAMSEFFTEERSRIWRHPQAIYVSGLYVQ